MERGEAEGAEAEQCAHRQKKGPLLLGNFGGGERLGMEEGGGAQIRREARAARPISSTSLLGAAASAGQAEGAEAKRRGKRQPVAGLYTYSEVGGSRAAYSARTGQI